MTQVAYLDGERILAYNLDQEAWAHVKQVRATHPSSLLLEDGTPAVPRSGPLVCQHFAHEAPQDHDPGEPESLTHKVTKQAVADLLRQAGWQAVTEEPGPGWRADVLATRGNTTLAVEVQLSAQDVNDYINRTDRYRQSGLDVLWLAQCTPATWASVRAAGVPAIPAGTDPKHPDQPVRVGHPRSSRTWPLTQALLLAVGHLLHPPTPPEQPSWHPAPLQVQICTNLACTRAFITRPDGQVHPFSPAASLTLEQAGAPWGLKAGTVTSHARGGAAATHWACPHCGHVLHANMGAHARLFINPPRRPDAAPFLSVTPHFPATQPPDLWGRVEATLEQATTAATTTQASQALSHARRQVDHALRSALTRLAPQAASALTAAMDGNLDEAARIVGDTITYATQLSHLADFLTTHPVAANSLQATTQPNQPTYRLNPNHPHPQATIDFLNTLNQRTQSNKLTLFFSKQAATRYVPIDPTGVTRVLNKRLRAAQVIAIWAPLLACHA